MILSYRYTLVFYEKLYTNFAKLYIIMVFVNCNRIYFRHYQLDMKLTCKSVFYLFSIFQFLKNPEAIFDNFAITIIITINKIRILDFFSIV